MPTDMATDVREALDRLPRAARRLIESHLAQACAGDWRRVTLDGAGFKVHNRPQWYEKVAEPEPVKKIGRVVTRAGRRPIVARSVEVISDFEAFALTTNCPRPDKLVYPSKADAEERRTTTWANDPTMSSYLCVCGFWHLGHRTRVNVP
jgi:hypothetical protein